MFQDFFYSPIGIVYIQANDQAIFDIGIIDKEVDTIPNHLTAICKTQLREYFAGSRTSFSLPLQLQGTAFEQAIYQTLRTIIFGTTISYGELAKKAGYPRAARAVGSAMQKNKLMLVVPCHRVLAAKNHLGGFAISLEKKKWLLHHENSSFKE